MTTTYELYTNENGTPKAVEGKAPAILERVENIEETLDNGVVTSVNGKTGALTPEQTGCLPLSGGTMTGAIEWGGVPLLGNSDGTLTWDGKSLLTEASNNPVGTVIAMAANSAPVGYLLCNGSAVSRTTYADLFAKIGTIYGEGDGSTTFNLPDLTDRFIQGSGTAGTVKSAGLPNIEGLFQSWGGRNGGAVVQRSLNGTITVSSGSASSLSHYNMDFDASKSNPIYGNSDTVQPPALTMRMYIKY